MVISLRGPRTTAVAVAPAPPPPVIVIVGNPAACVYPLPDPVTVIPVTLPSVICATAVACVLLGAPPPLIETLGSLVYEAPLVTTLIAITLPSTSAVAVAAVPKYVHSTVPTVASPIVCVG